MKIEELIYVICSSLNLPEGSIDENSSTENVEEWDSLGHLEMLMALDEASGGATADIVDLTQASSVAQMIEILKGEGVIE